ncbi:DUF2920 family protein [Clostridium botulinum]|uniref:DUF2920 family protein n=1 Tax=Clostridium TaxID=1485 RepID=UPI0013FBEE10|nr:MULTISPECIES: DUF2920 family protein [Clostridium]MCS6131036.1 DUF2920 family protein [Clostridium botulinum]NFL43800.1 DUF2920 family protein [Clostridium botulinum]NFL88771.1 DUF2920 family protein [Clostridium botulinum]
MAKEYCITEFAHNSIYVHNGVKDNYKNRQFNIYFSEPDGGINSDTGLLLFVAGFMGNASSNVYKKMRNDIADKYNLVTIQCDYFGWQFMQQTDKIVVPNLDINKINHVFTEEDMKKIYKSGKLDFDEFFKNAIKYDLNVTVNADLSGETLEDFNDMGIMQAIDNITAVLKVMAILYDNGYEFNAKKVIAYGHSHGAYLSYLCNAFAPTLFSLIIDNSAWIYPAYLNNNRYFIHNVNKFKLNIEFDYLAKKLDIDKELLSLQYIYSNFKNRCKIICYHGTTDNLISNVDKSKFCESVENCEYNEISLNEVDGDIFKSTNHGLDADFFKLFDFIYNKVNKELKKDNFIDLQNDVIIKTNNGKYLINYDDILPEFIQLKG